MTELETEALPTSARPGIDGRFALALACMGLSGGAALIYEVVWLRLLSLVMGSTAYALSAMLTAFLGGLALGAWLAGRATRTRPASLAAYASLELGIALLAGAMPALVEAAGPLFGASYRAFGDHLVAYSVMQLLIAGSLLLLPTALMGATLPVLTAAVVRGTRGLTARVGDLYGANSLGGAAGAALCGFVLLPDLGMRGTSLLAAGLNVAVALLALAAARIPPRPAAEDTPEEAAETAARAEGSDDPAPPPFAVAGLYAVSGFATLTLQVAWARVVGLSIGSTSYGFAITLSSFILGIALGSVAAARIGWLARHPVRAIALLHFAIAVSAALSVAWLARLPLWVAALFGDELSFGELIVRQVALVGATILVPTLAMGALFPLVTEVLHRGAAAPGQAVGSTYAANTWGTIAGSFVAGFVLIPTIGMRGAIALAAGLSASVGIAWLVPALSARRVGAWLRAAAALGAVALAAYAAPDWNRTILTSGPYLYGRALAARMPAGASPDEIAAAWTGSFGELVDYREGASGVVTLRRQGARLSLQVGGKSDAYSYASTQNLIAHLPLLLHRGDARDVLVIGIGSGNTLGSALAYDVGEVDAVEISPEVVDFARRHFAPFNGGALDDPRVHVLVGDGRNHLRHSGKSYDVIISQPSNPWMSGSASLFTRDFFEEVRAHLRPDGVACLWFLITDEEAETLRSILHTFSDVFENAFLFDSLLLGEYVLIGTRDPGPWSGVEMARRLEGTPAGADLARLGNVGAPELAGLLLLGPEPMQRFAAEGVMNTDDNAYVEFFGPRSLRSGDRLRAQRELEGLRPDPLTYFVEGVGDRDPVAAHFAERVEAIRASKPLVLEARELEEDEGRGPDWLDRMRRAAALNPADPYAGRFVPQDGESGR